MLHHLPTENILFLDIETVSARAQFEELEEKWQHLWELKAQFLRGRGEEDTPSSVYDRAGIFAEFGKIICISVGFISGTSEQPGFRLKSFAGEDEKLLLTEFAGLLNTRYNECYSRRDNPKGFLLCGHNGKEFDFPFIARRMLVHGIRLPKMLDVCGKKPWETEHLLDTMEMWKFGDFKSYTSLNLLAALFDIPTPKDDIDGSMIYHTYWKEKDLARIVTYCQKDVLTVAQLLRRYRGEPLIAENMVSFAKNGAV